MVERLYQTFFYKKNNNNNKQIITMMRAYFGFFIEIFTLYRKLSRSTLKFFGKNMAKQKSNSKILFEFRHTCGMFGVC